MAVFPPLQHLSLKQSNDPFQRAKLEPQLIIVLRLFQQQSSSPSPNLSIYFSEVSDIKEMLDSLVTLLQ